MNDRFQFSLAYLLITALFLLSGPAFAETEGEKVLLSGEVEVGGRLFIHRPSEEDRGQFEAYRDIPAGPFLENLHLQIDRGDDFFLELRAREIGEEDQNVLLRGGHLGRSRFELEWDQTPHIYSNRGRNPFVESSTGVFQIPDLLQTTLAGAAPAARPDILRGFLEAPPAIDLKSRWDTARFLWAWSPYPQLHLQAEYTVIHKQGTRPIGTTFLFTNQVELPEPIDQRIDDLKLTADLTRERWQLQIGYDLSLFNNDVDVLIWDNPLSAVDAVNAPIRGRLDLPPDNVSHTLHLAGAMNLPQHSRLSGTLSYSRRTQDDSFIPHTINTAISDPGLVLPAKGLNGEVDIWTANLRFTSRPVQNVGLKSYYRFYGFNNKTPELIFPAQVRTDLSVLDEAVRSAGINYKKESAGAGADWRWAKPLSLGVAYDWTRWHRDDRHREAPTTNDQTPKVSLDYTPIDSILLRTSYSRSWRRNGDYNPFAHLEHTEVDVEGIDTSQAQHVLLRKYDEADRDRSRVDLLAQISPKETLSFTPSVSYRKDDYKNSPLGLQEDKNWAAGLDLSWSPIAPGVTVYASYMREAFDALQRSRYRTPPSQLDNPTYDWVAENKDKIDTVGFAVNIVLIESKVDLNLSWNASRAVGAMRASNPTPPVGGTAAQNSSATALNFPDITERLQRLEAALRYSVSPALFWRLRYILEKFNITDFRTDEVQPFMGDVEAGSGTSIYLGAQIRDYTAQILSFIIGYRF